VRHAVLGAGGIGGLVAGGLARAGADVVLLLRPETLDRHPGRQRVESVVLGNFEAEVRTAAALRGHVDVLWVTVKAPQLEAALELAPPERAGDAAVVPLLNGIDHVSVLRAQYGSVLAASIVVESERVEPGLVRHLRGTRVALAPGERRDAIADELRSVGFDVAFGPDEATVLWEKLALIAPLALTTTALGAPVGAVQAEPEWASRLIRCHDETVAVGLAFGGSLDPPKLRRVFDSADGDLRTSMQKDFDAGRRLELDAIAGPVVRGGLQRGIATPATAELASFVEERLAERAISRG
jgi:2-dehydropantoate 2-reductase